MTKVIMLTEGIKWSEQSESPSLGMANCSMTKGLHFDIKNISPNLQLPMRDIARLSNFLTTY
jgi:hypothetical protein